MNRLGVLDERVIFRDGVTGTNLHLQFDCQIFEISVSNGGETRLRIKQIGPFSGPWRIVKTSGDLGFSLK